MRGATCDRVKLLLLPGTLCDAALWTPVVAGVSDLAECVVGDVGRDDRIEAIADALLAEHPGSMAVAGFSFGGFVAIRMAATTPDQITGLALIGTVAIPLPIEQHPERMRRLAIAQEHGVDPYIAGLMPAYLHPDHVDNPGLADVIAGMARRLGLDVLRRQVAANMTRPDARPLLARLSMPTMVLCGSHDLICPPEQHRVMAAAIPGAVLTEVPDAGHFVTLEKPDAVVAAIRNWLGRVADAQT